MECQVHAGEEDHARPGGQHQYLDRTPCGKINGTFDVANPWIEDG